MHGLRQQSVQLEGGGKTCIHKGLRHVVDVSRLVCLLYTEASTGYEQRPKLLHNLRFTERAGYAHTASEMRSSASGRWRPMTFLLVHRADFMTWSNKFEWPPAPVNSAPTSEGTRDRHLRLPRAHIAHQGFTVLVHGTMDLLLSVLQGTAQFVVELEGSTSTSTDNFWPFCKQREHGPQRIII